MKRLTCVALLALSSSALAARPPILRTPQARMDRLNWQIQESADQAHSARLRTALALSAGGALLITQGVIDAGPFFSVTSNAVAYTTLGTAFFVFAASSFFATSPEEKLADEVIVDTEVLTPELKLMATEKRLQAMARDVRRQRMTAGWFGVGLTAVSAAGFALTSPSNRGLAVIGMGAGLVATLTHWLIPSTAERLWASYAQDYGIVDLALTPQGPQLAVSWRF